MPGGMRRRREGMASMRRLDWSLLIVTMWISAGHAVPVSTGTPVKVVGAIGPNTGSASVTVPSDAQLMVCSVTGFSNTSGYFSGGSLTIAGAAMTVVTGGDAKTGLWESALWYKVSPATGSQTLAWDWVGTADADASSSIACAWYKSLDTASPVRSSLCAQSSGSPYATGTMTAQSGDLAVAFVAAFATSADQTFSFVNAT